MQFHCEDGLELLSRFREKPSSMNLDEVLFPTGISNDKIVEIVGASSTGKTLLLCQFLAKCILPTQYKEIQINGCNVCAIIIDTLGQIKISKITEFMIPMIHNAYQNIGVIPSVEVVDSIMNRSLQNLTVFRCCNNDQFQIIVNMLENELLGNEKIAVLAIDNIFAYYWQERKKNILTIDSYVKGLIKLIRTRMSQFKIITLYTKLDRPISKYKSYTMDYNMLGGMGVNYKLQLYKSTEPHKFVCHVKSMEDTKQIQYTICNSGIKWIL